VFILCIVYVPTEISRRTLKCIFVSFQIIYCTSFSNSSYKSIILLLNFIKIKKLTKMPSEFSLNCEDQTNSKGQNMSSIVYIQSLPFFLYNVTTSMDGMLQDIHTPYSQNFKTCTFWIIQ